MHKSMPLSAKMTDIPTDTTASAYWASHGFTGTEGQAWDDVGVHNAPQANALRQAGVSPAQLLGTNLGNLINAGLMSVENLIHQLKGA